MPPVILEARDVIGGGRYLQEVRISTFSPTREQQKQLRANPVFENSRRLGGDQLQHHGKDGAENAGLDGDIGSVDLGFLEAPAG